ncbi:hypothetical protein ES707_15600 [subsurface metagenome]
MNTPDIFSNGKYSKILLTFGFILIIHNFLILYLHQPQGYVVDIYSVLPLSFYGASILCYLISSLVLLLDLGSAKKFGILLLILNHAVILLTPYMLGYYSMGRADDIWYIGEYVHILETGSISGWNIYPGSLILGAALSMIPGLPANGAAFVMPFVFSFIFIGGLCLCCRFFLKEEKLVNIAVLSSFIFYLGPYNFLNVPHALFFAYMPLFIFILSRYIKKPDFATAALVLIPTVLVPFMHPFIVLFVVALLLVLILFGRVLNRFIHGNYWRATRPLVVLFTGFFSWFIYCDALLGNFGRSYRGYLQRTTEPVLLETVDKLAHINVDLFKMTKLLVVYYGRYIIPLIIIGIALVLVYLKRDKISQLLKNRMHFFLIFYIMFLGAEAVLFLNPMFSHQPDRMTNLNFIVYAQVPLFVLSLSVIFAKFAKSKFFNRQMILLLILLASTWGLSLFGTFDSPNIFRTNVTLTYNEVEGMEWFYEARDSENIIVPLSQIGRFHALFDDRGSDNYIPVPDHFGYDSSHRSFAETNLEYGLQSYVVLLTLDELLYQEVPGYVGVGRYTAGDYARFRNDQSVDVKIYDNLNIEVYATNNVDV